MLKNVSEVLITCVAKKSQFLQKRRRFTESIPHTFCLDYWHLFQKSINCSINQPKPVQHFENGNYNLKSVYKLLEMFNNHLKKGSGMN